MQLINNDTKLPHQHCARQWRDVSYTNTTAWIRCHRQWTVPKCRVTCDHDGAQLMATPPEHDTYFIWWFEALKHNIMRKSRIITRNSKVHVHDDKSRIIRHKSLRPIFGVLLVGRKSIVHKIPVNFHSSVVQCAMNKTPVIQKASSLQTVSKHDACYSTPQTRPSIVFCCIGTHKKLRGDGGIRVMLRRRRIGEGAVFSPGHVLNSVTVT